MKKYFLAVFWLLTQDALCQTQMAYKPEVYKKKVYDFYSHILNKKFTSLKDYEYFFGPYSEDEIYLFFNGCRKGKSEEECVKISKERHSRPSSYESLVFLELKKLKHLLTLDEEDYIEAILSKMKILDNAAPSAIDIELKFANNVKLVFVLNNVEREPPYIIDIFLPNGSSIFKKLELRSDNWIYKRLAKINDSDGHTNVREKKGVKSSVKFKLDQQDIFFFYPNYQETWWVIEKLDCERGYVSSDRIRLIGELTDKERISLRDTVTYIYSKPPFCN